MKNQPKMKLPSLLLIVLNFLFIFGGYELFNGNSIFETITIIQHNINDFIIKVKTSVENFEKMGSNTHQSSVETEMVIAKIIIVIFCICFIYSILKGNGKKFWRSIKRVFNPNLPDEKFYEIDEKLKKKITVDPAIKTKGYENVLINCCKKMNVNEVSFVFNKDKDANIQTIEESGCVSIIEVGQSFFNSLYLIKNEELRKQFLVFSICHELTHVKHHDAMNLKWCCILGDILFLDGLFFSLIIQKFMSSYLFIVFLFDIIWVCIFSAFCRPSVWSFGFEYRADRTAVLISEISSSKLTTILNLLFPNGTDDSKRNLIKIFFDKKKKTCEYAHPTMNQRKKEFSIRRKWTYFDFFRVALKKQIKELPEEIFHG